MGKRTLWERIQGIPEEKTVIDPASRRQFLKKMAVAPVAMVAAPRIAEAAAARFVNVSKNNEVLKAQPTYVSGYTGTIPLMSSFAITCSRYPY